MFQAGVAIVERDALIEGLIDLYFGASEAEPACLLGNLEASALPLHDVVVTNHALVHQAADTIEDLRSSTPRGFFFARLPSETAVVVGAELSQHGIGGVPGPGSCPAHVPCLALFQYPPPTPHATLSPRPPA